MNDNWRIEQQVGGEWTFLRNISATLVALVSALSCREPGAKWRLVRDDGQVFYP